MSRISNNQPLELSVLDRLSHDAVASWQQGSAAVLEDLKQTVRRDLENLLNTRWRCAVWPPDLTELETSLVNYGIPDFTGANLGSASDREEFRYIIEKIIKRFEPRFNSVRVELLENSDKLDRTMRFRIVALLRAKPHPEPVAFNTSVEPTSASVTVEGQA